MNARSTRTITVAIAAALLAVAAGAATREETIERALAFSPGSLLQVNNTNGWIKVSEWDGDGVHVVAEKKVRTRGEDVDEAFAALHVVIEETPEGVRIDTEYPRRRDGGWWRDVSMSVNYRIQVPARANLNLETVNGKVDVRGVTGELTLASTNGGITVTDSGGWVDAHTTNGGIDVELHEFAAGEDMTFRTTNGGISLAVPEDFRANVEARTTNGGVHIDFPVTVEGSLSKKRLDGVINGGGGRIDLRTTNGGIRIEQI